MKLKKIVKFVIFSLCFVTASYSQDMNPPKPIESAYFDKWIGEWTGENEFGGVKGKQTVVCTWDMNHQFMVVNVTGTADGQPDRNYKAVGYYTIDSKGSVKGWWFDIWGAAGVSTATGKITGDKLESTESGDGFTSSGYAEFTGNNDVVFDYKGYYEMNGRKMPFERKSSYKRK